MSLPVKTEEGSPTLPAVTSVGPGWPAEGKATDLSPSQPRIQGLLVGARPRALLLCVVASVPVSRTNICPHMFSLADLCRPRLGLETDSSQLSCIRGSKGLPEISVTPSPGQVPSTEGAIWLWTLPPGVPP